ncbi:MAG: prolyl oligopeptidase family serine peptidase [Rubripirellula sp.]
MTRLMFTIYLLLFPCMSLLPCLAVGWDDAAGQQTVQRMSGGGDTLQYLLYLPNKYSEKKRWPLVLFLHGSGERGVKIDRVKKHGPPKLVAAGRQFPFILVSPQCLRDQRWDAKQLGILLSQLEAKYPVDGNRIYVTGLSMGGTGTWALAASDPDRLAAIAPICGRGDSGTAKSFAELPTWVFHGAKDPTVPISESQHMVDALKVAGGRPRFTIYPNAKHDSWTAAYSNPQFYDWLLRQQRN